MASMYNEFKNYKESLLASTSLRHVKFVGQGAEKIITKFQNNNMQSFLAGFGDYVGDYYSGSLESRINNVHNIISKLDLNLKTYPVNDFQPFIGQAIITNKELTRPDDVESYLSNKFYISIIPDLEDFRSLKQTIKLCGSKKLFGELMVGINQNEYDKFVQEFIENALDTGNLPDFGNLGNVMTDGVSLKAVDSKAMPFGKLDTQYCFNSLYHKLSEVTESKERGVIGEKLHKSFSKAGVKIDKEKIYDRSNTYGLGFYINRDIYTDIKPPTIIEHLGYAQLKSSVKDVESLAQKTMQHLGFNR